MTEYKNAEKVLEREHERAPGRLLAPDQQLHGVQQRVYDWALFRPFR